MAFEISRNQRKSNVYFILFLTLHMLNCFKDYQRCIHISLYILAFVQQNNTKFTMTQLYIMPILFRQYYARWRFGDIRSPKAVKCRFQHHKSATRNMPPNRMAWWRHQMETFSALLPFVRGIHRSPVNSPHKGQWRRALVFCLICARINNREAGDVRRHRGHCDVIVMEQ